MNCIFPIKLQYVDLKASKKKEAPLIFWPGFSHFFEEQWCIFVYSLLIDDNNFPVLATCHLAEVKMSL